MLSSRTSTSPKETPAVATDYDAPRKTEVDEPEESKLN